MSDVTASIAAASTQVAYDEEFVDSLIISPLPSQTTTPHVTSSAPTPTQPQAGPSTISKSAKIIALEGKVSCLEAQVVGVCHTPSLAYSGARPTDLFKDGESPVSFYYNWDKPLCNM
ncbi:hypothetical protein L1987_46390 [Smallanthus sonchifolius]|uniref:Uncharacterized protein n=1 Tax=Smallanthus sonchifolius TaxID=185202 RepID=A0ACB9FZ16_9ASTR|nr:hypothetical protein L1987_46390 [Smallanthus sonchifolius]